MNLQIATMRCQCQFDPAQRCYIPHHNKVCFIRHHQHNTSGDDNNDGNQLESWLFELEQKGKYKHKCKRGRFTHGLEELRLKERAACWTTIKGTHYKRTMWLFSKTGWKGQCQDWWQQHTDRLCIYMKRTWDGQVRHWQVKARLTNNFWLKDVSWVWILEGQPKWGRQMWIVRAYACL